ncbi:MAG: response regulator [Acidobacteriaceae bacterium]|nr:response regulator [Acidobacteriaceae bacterium]
MPHNRVLFVDDEPNIRLTLPKILEQHGFNVTVAATVTEALNAINLHEFDVLVSDLNIGHPADGFMVVSAMRRAQPSCVNLILTGYPAFETALRAMQAQVDDYLVKPAEIEQLVGVIQQKTSARQAAATGLAVTTIAELLRKSTDEIQRIALRNMKADTELGALSMSDENRVGHVSDIVRELAAMLERGATHGLSPPRAESAARHGRLRQQQGYTAPMLVADARAVQRAIFRVVQDRILELNLSLLVTDLSSVVDNLQWQLHEALRAFGLRRSVRPKSA